MMWVMVIYLVGLPAFGTDVQGPYWSEEECLVAAEQVKNFLAPEAGKLLRGAQIETKCIRYNL